MLAQGVPPAVAEQTMPLIEKAEEVVVKKAKRKVTKYQRELGRQLKKLKKKHPRTPVSKLMKRAHRATKKVMK